MSVKKPSSSDKLKQRRLRDEAAFNNLSSRISKATGDKALSPYRVSVTLAACVALQSKGALKVLDDAISYQVSRFRGLV